MHKTQSKTNPPMSMPVHAMGCPVWLCLRILFNEIKPKINARSASRKLAGKQMMPVNGIGAQPAQKDRTVKIPRIKLMIEC